MNYFHRRHAKALKQGEIKVRQVEDLTGYPEILDGRVKTLHPKVFGALPGRARQRTPRKRVGRARHRADRSGGRQSLSLRVGGDPRAFEEKELVEYIDIGGVTLLRAAGKNFHDVGIVCDPRDYTAVLEELEAAKPEPGYETAPGGQGLLRTRRVMMP